MNDKGWPVSFLLIILINNQKVGRMSLFILGLILGSFLSFFLITMLANSKKADEIAFRYLEEGEGESPKCLPVTQ